MTASEQNSFKRIPVYNIYKTMLYSFHLNMICTQRKKNQNHRKFSFMSTPTCLKQDWGAGIASFSLRYSSQSKLPIYK